MHRLRQALVAVLVLGWVAGSLQAQEIGRFQWKRGQTFQYRMEQTTRATDTSSEGKNEMSSQVKQVKSWQVLDVDAAGVATVQLTLTQLTMQQKLPKGDVWTFDSAAPEKSHPQLKQQLSPLVGKPLTVLRVDPTGKVLEVKSTLGAASRYESELPFAVTLPGTALKPEQTWTRSYQIVLDPPLGTGEKIAATQNYLVRSVANGQARIAFGTTIKEMPESASDRLPLLQMQPRGEVLFDASKGLVTATRIVSSGTVKGHHGDDSSYEFVSDLQEQLIAN
jgi:hypothetical protein